MPVILFLNVLFFPLVLWLWFSWDHQITGSQKDKSDCLLFFKQKLHISNQFILRYQCFHNGPAQQIGDGTEDEDDKVA